MFANLYAVTQEANMTIKTRIQSRLKRSKRYVFTRDDFKDIRIGSIAMVRVALDALEPVEEDEE